MDNIYITFVECWLECSNNGILFDGNQKKSVWAVLLFENPNKVSSLRLVLSTKENDLAIKENTSFEFSEGEIELDYDNENIEIHHSSNILILELKNKQKELLKKKVCKKELIKQDDLIGTDNIDGFYHLISLNQLKKYNNKIDIQQINDKVVVLFDVDKTINEYNCFELKMKLRTPLLKKSQISDCEEVCVDLRNNKSIHYAHFNTKYNQLSIESTLYIQVNYINDSNDIVQAKYLLYLFDLDGRFITSKKHCLMPVERITKPTYSQSKKCVSANEREQTKIDITINTLDSIYLIPKEVSSIWKEFKEYPFVPKEKIFMTLNECEKVTKSEDLPTELAIHLFTYRYFYLDQYFKQIGFYILKSTIQASIETGKDYLSDVIEFLEEKKIIEQIISEKSFSFLDVLPYFSVQTNSNVLKERIGHKMIGKITLEDIEDYIPHVIEILKHERTDFMLEYLRELIQKNGERAQRFGEQIMWNIVNIIEKRDEYFDVFIKLFHEFALFVTEWNPTIIDDIICAIELISRVEEINQSEKEKNALGSFVSFFSNFISSGPNMKIQTMKGTKNFSLPFLKGNVVEIISLKQYGSANHPMVIPVRVETKEKQIVDSCFMVKSNDDLLNDKLIIILSNYVYNSLKNQIDLQYLTYDIIELGNKKGIVEFVPNVLEIAKILDKKEYFSMIMGNSSKTETDELAKFIYILKNHLMDEEKNDVEKESDYQEKIKAINSTIKTDALNRQLNFAKSFALCCVLNYAFMLRDRHGDNYLFQYTTGKVFHIDFGFIFGNCVPGKEKEPQITRFSQIMKLLDDLHLTQSFYHYARWAWEKVKELAQNIITLYTFICYDSIESKYLVNVRDRLLKSTFDDFIRELTERSSLEISDSIQANHKTANFLRKYNLI